ncbi:MAG: hypothetical protein JST00_15500 [Deltaproteobacteria bacterium]|nr:hypothetical protein [Deltaproteobacteria bacterium]
MGDAILGGDTWQVHLGRSGGKLMSRAELEAAVASNEIGLETLVREPGSFTWTTAGAATGRSTAPATPPEPESSDPITLASDDSDVHVGSFHEVTSVEVAPTTSDVPDASAPDRGFTEDEEEVTRPVPIGRSLAILAGVAFLAGAIVVAAPWRASPADALAKANAKTAMPAPPPSTGAPVIVTSVLPPPPEATPPEGSPSEATPEASTSAKKPPAEERKGAIVVVVVPPKPTPIAHATPPAKPAQAPVAKAPPAKSPTATASAPPARPATAKPASAKAALPPVHPPPKPAAVAVSGHAHAHAAPPPRTASATPRAAPAKAPRAPKPAAARR